MTPIDSVTRTNAPGTTTRPLSNFRIVEFLGKGPGPFAAQLLRQLGAEITTIDRPGDGVGGFLPVGERTIVTLDLKNPEDVARALELIAEADVLIEGFRPGVMERLGVGPAECLKANPRLVYARMTGWGQTGPLAPRAGHDINYIALSGALHAFRGSDGHPAPPLNLVGDYAGGSLYLILGILAAAHRVQRTGDGEVLDVAIVDGVAHLLTSVCGAVATGQWDDNAPGTNLLDGGAPFYRVYETSDHKYIAVGSIEPQFYRVLLEGLELDPGELPDQYDHSAWPLLVQRFKDVIRTRTRDEWWEVFRGVDACVTPVLTIEESVRDQHMTARGVWQSGPHPVPAPAPRFFPGAEFVYRD